MLWWAAPALASPITEDALVEMLDGLAPRVEAVAGRRLLARPQMVIDDKATVFAALVQPPPAAREDTPEDAARRAEEATALLARALAVYDPGTERVYVVSDTMRALFRETGTDAALVRPFVECVLAHELTHALQHQWAVPDDGDPERRALVEGHASWVAHRVCAGPADAYARAVDSLDIVSSVDPADPSAWTYLYGERYVDAWIARYGVEAFWWRLGEAPPTREQVLAVVTPQLAPGWRDADALADAVVGPLRAGGWARDAEPASPYATFATLGGDGMGARNAVQASGGLVARFVRGGEAAVAMAFLLDSPASAEDWIAARAADLRRVGVADVKVLSGSPLTFEGIERQDALPRRLLPRGAEGSLDFRVRLVGGQAYLEMWARRGPVVYGVARNGPRDVNGLAGALAAAMALPLATTAPGVEASPDAIAALDASRPPAELPPARPSGAWYANRLAVLGRVDPRACVAGAEAALPTVAPAGLPVLTGVAADCARTADDVAAALRLSAVAGRGADWDPVNLLLAESLVLAQRPVEALARLDAVTVPSPLRDALALHTYVELKRWDDVLPLLGDAAVDARLRAWAASRLWASGRRAEGARALAPLCASLDTADDRDACERLAKIAR